MGSTLTLTTDFGHVDGYVAAMKGVVLGINPDVRLIDVCHDIGPQNVAQAAFVLSTAYPFFPPKTVHLIVVDPGVGTDRRAVILRTPTADYVAPDNGVLSYVIRDFGVAAGETGNQPGPVKTGVELEAVAITESRFWRTPVSPTFHGRDIFAPVAALLSLGFPPVNFGEEIDSLVMLPLPEPGRGRDGAVTGNVLHVDNFGNLVTNIRAEDLAGLQEPLSIMVAGQVIPGLSHTYGDGQGLLALIGSSGYLEYQ
jgi:S-adenosylmethionine hydrolase